MNKQIASILLALALILSAASLALAQTAETETVVIGTEGAYAPFNYINKDGEPDGYDIAVARAVDELVPELQFEFAPTEWSSIFVAMESGRYDIIVSQIGWNAEREAKYLFGETPYSWSVGAIVYAKGREDIRSIEDLYGKTVAAGLGSANTTWLENYNAEHESPIEIAYTDGDVSKMLQDIVNGRADATLNSPVTTKLIAEEQGLAVDWTVWLDKGISPVYFLYANNENGQRYKALIEPALQTLLDNGTLSALSIQYLGADYATEAAVQAQAED